MSALDRQLAVIRGGEQAGYFELRLIAPAGNRQTFVPLDEPERVSSVLSLQAPHGDLYLGAAVRGARRGTADAVRACWCVWADCDTREACDLVDSFEIEPSLIVKSGGGLHCYWALMDACPPAAALAINKRMVHAFGADPKSTDVARVLRPVGALNHKFKPPALVALAPGRCRWTHLDLLDAALPELPPEPAPAPLRAAREAVDDSGDPLKAIPAAEYVPHLSGREFGRDRKARCPFHGDGKERAPSLHAYGTGWTCYGSCSPLPGSGKQYLGGGIYQFAALLWDYELPIVGEPFLNVKKGLEAIFLDPEMRTT